LRHRRAQVREGFPPVKKMQQGSGERLRSHLASRQKVFENEMPGAPVDNYKRRSQVAWLPARC